MLANPETLQDGFVPTGEAYIVAARMTGPLTTAFPDGKPQEMVPNSEIDAPIESPSQAPNNHTASIENANVILMGDVDFLSDRLWVQKQNFLGQQLTTAFASNGDFVINALDNLSGSAELIGIRARGTYSRPFTRVEALRRDAEVGADPREGGAHHLGGDQAPHVQAGEIESSR